MFLAGERLDPDTWAWAGERLGVPVVDHWWQTETGWPIVANPRGLEPLPIKPGSPSVPGAGLRRTRAGRRTVRRGRPARRARSRSSCRCRPGTLPTVWGDDQRFVDGYLSAYPGHYLTGDGGYVDEDGYVFVMGRTDDVINVAGHRLSTGAIEAVLATHPAVAECAVIGVADELKGQVPRALVVVKEGYAGSAESVADELVALVRAEMGAVVALRQVDVVAALAQDPLGQDPAQDDAGDRRRAARHRAVDHRGPGGGRPAATRAARAPEPAPAP